MSASTSTPSTRRRHHATAAALACILALALAAPVFASHGPQAPGGPYSGFSSGAVIHVDALTLGTQRAADVEVGLADASVNSEGLRKVNNEYSRPIVPEDRAKHSRGHSSIVEAGVLLSPPDIDNTVKPFEAETRAPGGEAVNAAVTNPPLAVSPAVFIDLLRDSSAARWNADTCVIGVPISQGEQFAARVEALETGDDAATPTESGFDKPVVGIDAVTGGVPRAASHVVSKEQIYRSGNTFGLMSVTATTLAPVTLLQGTANEFTIEVDGPAVLTAMADGKAGGAKVDYKAPLVSVIQNGTVQQVLPNEPLTLELPGGTDNLAVIKLSVLEPIKTDRGGLGSSTSAPNGTKAAGQTSVVEVKLLDTVSQNLRGATISLGHMEAQSVVPAGGIQCPLPVTKVASPPSVRVGQTFVTTITVDNPFACPLTGVTLTDEISVEDDARFSISDTNPAAAATPGGSNLSSGTVRWNLGTIAAGRSKSVTVTLLAQGGAGLIIDEATAGGTLDNCPAKPGGTSTDVTGLAKIDVPVSGVATLQETVTKVAGEKLPRTGVTDSAAAGLALLAAAAVLGAVVRRKQSPTG